MSFVCSHLRKATKRYRCYLCGERIEMGDDHEYRTGANEDGFWSMRIHHECAQEVDEDRDFDWEGFDEGSLSRPMAAFDPAI